MSDPALNDLWRTSAMGTARCSLPEDRVGDHASGPEVPFAADRGREQQQLRVFKHLLASHGRLQPCCVGLRIDSRPETD